jgi:hypothetical protein
VKPFSFKRRPALWISSCCDNAKLFWESTVSVESTILTYFGELEADRHPRYRSWEHSFRYFQQVNRSRLAERAEKAAIHLGFYLASWGMYRGRSFLLQRDYTVHCGAIECLADSRWSALWTREFGASDDDDAHAGELVELRQCIGADVALPARHRGDVRLHRGVSVRLRDLRVAA